MEAYDTAVLSYALATAANKLKPGLLGIAPNLNVIPSLNTAAQRAEDVSLTPPRPEPPPQESEDCQGTFYQLLTSLEQTLLNKKVVQLPQLLTLCAANKQLDTQGANLLESLHNELLQVCKVQPGVAYQLDLVESDAPKPLAGSLKTEPVCVALAELLRHFGLTEGANLLWSQFF